MKKEISIYTTDSMYAYKFRNKFKCDDWNVEYISRVEDLQSFLKYNSAGIIFVDGRCCDTIECIASNNSQKFVFVFLDDDNSISQEYYANQQIVVTNSDRINFDMPYIYDRYLNILKKESENIGMRFFSSVHEALASFGLSPKRIGYKYLQDCVEICLDLNKSFICFKSDIYPLIAKNYNVSLGAVEKSIRSSIKEAYEKFPELFNNESFKLGHPTNNKFINFVIKRIKL